jgi:hypothetical protein
MHDFAVTEQAKRHVVSLPHAEIQNKRVSKHVSRHDLGGVVVVGGGVVVLGGQRV